LIKNFISITKPGIIFGNLITVAGGFFLASHGVFYPLKLVATLLGISLIIAAGCVFNNIIDRDIDILMERTKNRVMVKGLLSPQIALIYGLILSLAGAMLLAYLANALTLAIALIGLFFYVIVYTLGFKRSSIYGTLVGSISGAVPPVVGYCAVSNQFDLGALILFIILSLWQMPHSYAIAIFRFNDYAEAKIPVLPVVKGIKAAKLNMLIFVSLFAIAVVMLSVAGYAGKWYLLVAILVALRWLMLAIAGFKASDDKAWARKMFGFSILAITILSIMMALDSVKLGLH
jgi:protoheme IX farnesyltransferase